jgi:hypothetical protein
MRNGSKIEQSFCRFDPIQRTKETRKRRSNFVKKVRRDFEENQEQESDLCGAAEQSTRNRIEVKAKEITKRINLPCCLGNLIVKVGDLKERN